MRVLHITRDFPPRINGGISTAVGGMVGCCSRRGIECAVISFDAWRPRARNRGDVGPPEAVIERDDSGAVETLRLSEPAQLGAAHAFADRFAPAVLHIHHSMLWPFAAEVRARLSAPAIAQVHVVQAAQNRVRGLSEPTLSLTAQIQALGACDRVVVPSRAAAQMLAESYPQVPAARIVGLGIDDSEEARAAVGARADRAGGGDTVLYVGRFADINGIGELFGAIPRVLAARPDAHFIVAGGVPDNRKAEQRWQRRFQDSASESVRARVSFPGWQTRERLSGLYRGASMLVSPSWLETFGLVVLEAMLYGLPIAATRSGGVQELIEHGRTGLLCAPRDVAALADSAIELLSHKERACRLGQAAADEVRAQRLWRHVGPELAALYREVTDSA